MAFEYYSVLEIGIDADDAAVKRAYRRLALEWHPDRNPGNAVAADRFKQICEAYEVLSDPHKRRLYDRLGRSPQFSQAAGAVPDLSSFGAAVADTVATLVDNFATGGKGDERRAGRDMRYVLELDLEEAALGCKKVVEIPRETRCGHCHAVGAEPGTNLRTCPTCHGDGRVMTGVGPLRVPKRCPRCRGKGTIPETPCTVCHGSGRVVTRARLVVTVPAGVDSETQLKLRGDGEPGKGGATPGDLFIDIAVRPHALFTREGPHLRCRVTVPMTRAALGGTITLPTLTGPRDWTLASGTDSHMEVRLPGEGLPQVGKGPGRGDLIATIVIETPKTLTPEQRVLLEHLDALATEGTQPESAGFAARLSRWLARGANP